MKTSLKQKAIELRKRGFSYSDIQGKIHVSKSTLSLWLRNISYTPNISVRNRLMKAREASKKAKLFLKHKSVKEAQESAYKKIQNISERDMFIFGLGLYCGEGSKTNITRIVNSDHRIISYAVAWFNTFYGTKHNNFTVRIHAYPETNIRDARRFWSDKTGLPLSRFQKEHIDTRRRKKTGKPLHFGTAHLTIVSNGMKEKGVLLLREILASIDIVLGTAGVV